MESNLTQLKALAYDKLVQMETVQKELSDINQQIANLKDLAKASPEEAPEIAPDTAEQENANPSQ